MRHKHSKRHHKKTLSFWALPCLAILLAATGVWLFQPASENSLGTADIASSESENPFARALENPFPAATENNRLVYPYSVVAGGVQRPDELRREMARDRVVAAHYADFDVSKARVVKLSAPKKAYVSYRMKDRVYWTKKKVTLARGETLITDGKHYARTRCANRVSDSAQASVSPQEPAATILDTPVASGSAALMAYLPSAVRRGLAPESLGGSSTGGGSGAGNDGGGPSSSGFGAPGYGGGAFLPAAGGSGGGGAPSGGGGTPGGGTPGDGSGAPTGGTGGGSPAPGVGGTGNTPSSNPPDTGTPGSNPPDTETPGSNPPDTETPGSETPGTGNGSAGNPTGDNPTSQPGGGNGSLPGGEYTERSAFRRGRLNTT
jgi:hypothetical protein